MPLAPKMVGLRFQAAAPRHRGRARDRRWSRAGNPCASRMIPLESPVLEMRKRAEEPPTPYRPRASPRLYTNLVGTLWAARACTNGTVLRSCVMKAIDFLAATECATKGWHQARDESPVDVAATFAMEQSREVKKLARELVAGGTSVYGGGRFDDTRQLVAAAATKAVYDAAFRAGSLIAEVDILSRDGGGWNVIEVKSSFPDSNKMGDYVDALAYSTMVLRRAAVLVRRSSLLLLSRTYQRGDPVEELFTLVDKTDDVDKRAQAFEQDVDAIAGAVLAEEPPQPILNRACWRCGFFKASCLGSGRGHTVVELPKLHHTRIKALCEQGVINIADIPDGFKLNDTQERAKAVMEAGSMAVDAVGLDLALATIQWPCHYLDFETVATTLPLYDGYGCHDQVLTQFSVHHRVSLDAEPSHSEFLARAEESQERAVAENLLHALGGRGAIIVYSSFEQTRIKALADRFPDLARPLTALSRRLVDFEKIIRKHIYHPAFAGSFSLKKVVPTLVTDVGYEDLAVRDGSAAIALFAQMARGEVEDVEEARRSLLAYCKTDTFVMVRLHEILAGMALRQPQ